MRRFGATIRRRPAVTALWTVCLAAALCRSVVGAPAGEIADPFTPRVTRREADLLARVTALAGANATNAIELLRGSMEEDSSPALDFALGNVLFQSEKLPAAAEAYENALAKMPTFRRAMLNLGRVYLLMAEPDETIRVYRELLRQGAADAEAMVLLGHAFLQANDAVSAETAFRQALLLGPQDSEPRLGLAKSLVEQERLPEALALLSELLRRDPMRGELWNLRANILLELEKPQRALVAFESARRLGLADAGMLATLGDLYVNAGQPVEAAQAYEAAFAEEALPSRLLRAAQAMLALGERERARRILTRAQEQSDKAPDSLDDPQRRSLLRLRAELADQEGDAERACLLLEQVLRSDPLDGKALLMLAELRQSAGKLDAAVMDYERAARIAGYEARALLGQAQMEVQRARYEQALPLLEAAQAFEERADVARYLEQVRRLARQQE